MTEAPRARRDDRSAPWFDALAEGVLLIRRCAGCGHRARPDTVACPACRAQDLDWVAATGTGTVVCRIVDRGGPDGEPVILGLVELDEGPWLHTRLLGTAALSPGAPVTLTVLTSGDRSGGGNGGGGEPFPAFEPLRGNAQDR